MLYSRPVDRAHPACVLFVLDQSASMNDPIGGDRTAAPKAKYLADAVNRTLMNLVMKSTRGEGEVRDYFHVGVIGYGVRIGPALGGALAGRPLVPLSELAEQPLRLEERSKRVPDGAGGLVEQQVRFPVWIDPMANGPTPMCAALTAAEQAVTEFVASHGDSYPPIVLHVSDGEPTDGEPMAAAQALQATATADGTTLLLNLHVSSEHSPAVTFPHDETSLPDEHARRLYAISSLLPEGMRSFSRTLGYDLPDGSRGFVFNGDIEQVVEFLDIGTSVANTAGALVPDVGEDR